MAKKTLFKIKFESDFRIVGLFCREPGYRMCWFINNHLGFNFKMVHDFISNPENDTEPDGHIVFMFRHTSLGQTYFIISNRGSNGNRLFANSPNVDYLMLVKFDDTRFDVRDLLKAFRSVPNVVGAYMIDDALGRKKEGFLYDFEIFLTQELAM